MKKSKTSLLLISSVLVTSRRDSEIMNSNMNSARVPSSKNLSQVNIVQDERSEDGPSDQSQFNKVLKNSRMGCVTVISRPASGVQRTSSNMAGKINRLSIEAVQLQNTAPAPADVENPRETRFEEEVN